MLFSALVTACQDIKWNKYFEISYTLTGANCLWCLLMINIHSQNYSNYIGRQNGKTLTEAISFTNTDVKKPVKTSLPTLEEGIQIM